LIEEPVRAGTARLARCEKPHASFADPDDERAGAGSKNDGGMADPHARLEHQTGEAADWNVRPRTVFVRHHEGTIEHVELAFFDEQDR
jgi:hypothetical protein